MPYILFQSAQLTDNAKRQLITRLTDICSEITGIPQAFFFVSVHELPNDAVAIDGRDVNTLKADRVSLPGRMPLPKAADA